MPDLAKEAHRKVRASFKSRRALWSIQMRVLSLKPAGLREFQVSLNLVVQINLLTMAQEQPNTNESGSAARFILACKKLEEQGKKEWADQSWHWKHRLCRRIDWFSCWGRWRDGCKAYKKRIVRAVLTGFSSALVVVFTWITVSEYVMDFSTAEVYSAKIMGCSCVTCITGYYAAFPRCQLIKYLYKQHFR